MWRLENNFSKAGSPSPVVQFRQLAQQALLPAEPSCALSHRISKDGGRTRERTHMEQGIFITPADCWQSKAQPLIRSKIHIPSKSTRETLRRFMFDIPRGLSSHWRQSHHRTGAATLIKIHQGVASFQNSVLQAPRGHGCPEVRAGVITPHKRGCESIRACTSRHSVPTHCGILPP